MKNRRGFLLAEETLKIVVAVICIGFLVYFLTALYFNSQNKADLELAKASLNYLSEQINAGAPEVNIYNPEGWVITTWPNNYAKRNLFSKEILAGKSLFCENAGWVSCFCICEENNPNACDDKAVCVENSKGLMVEGAVKTGDFTGEGGIKIKNPPIVLKINYDDKKVALK